MAPTVHSTQAVTHQACRTSQVPTTITVVVEVASFDIQKINNPKFKVVPAGEQLGYANLAASFGIGTTTAAKPQLQKKNKAAVVLRSSHWFWQADRSNRPGNLITLCLLHTPTNKVFLHGWQPKVKSFKPETFMSTIYRRLVDTLSEQALATRPSLTGNNGTIQEPSMMHLLLLVVHIRPGQRL